MNKAESERLASLFEETGYQAVNDVAEADLIVVNTCVVRQNAEERAINKLANFKPLKKARPDFSERADLKSWRDLLCGGGCFFLWSFNPRGALDTCGLAGALAQVIQLGAADASGLHDFNRADHR